MYIFERCLSPLAPLLAFTGLAYWFNGIGGYDCFAFSTIMGASLSASNAMGFIHLFILSNSMHRANSRWKHFRWFGVIIMVFHWVALVALEGTRTAGKEERGGCAGESRCVTDVDGLALTVKWIMQLLNQMFQTVAFLVPLRMPAAEAANGVRLFSGGLKATGSCRKCLNISASSLQRRYSSGPIRRLPPVVDMSPESSGHGSPSRSSSNSCGESPPPAVPSSNLPPKSETPAASAAPSTILPLSSGTPSAAAGPLSSLRPASGTAFTAAAPSPSSPPPSLTPSVVAGPSPSSPPLTGTPSVGPGPSPSSIASARTPGVAEVSPSSSRGTPYTARAKGTAEKRSGSGRYGRPVGALYFASRTTKNMRRTPGPSTTGTAMGNADGVVVNTGIAFTRSTPPRSMSARAAGAKHDESTSAVRSASTASVTTGGRGTAAAGGTAAERIQSRCSSISTMPAAAPGPAGDDREPGATVATARLGIPDAVVTAAPWKWHQQPGLTKLQRPLWSTDSWASSRLMKVALATDASSGSFSAVSSETTSSTSPERHAEAHKKMPTETPDGVRIAAAAAAAAAAHTVVWPLPLNASTRASRPSGGKRHARLSARALASSPSAAKVRAEKKEARRTGSGSRRNWHHKKRAKKVTETESETLAPAASATAASGGRPPSSFLWREVGLQGTGSHSEAPDAPASAASASTTNDAGAHAAETGKRPRLERRTSSSATSRSRYSAAAWSAFSAASWCSSSFDGNDNQRGAPAATVRSPPAFYEGNDSNG
ncbi:unnamed protein product [Ectocarpus sp. CCAP 1310/34]|nr:unnamed protein product [Ectocarpus sp. CCAP 1310/34]